MRKMLSSALLLPVVFLLFSGCNLLFSPSDNKSNADTTPPGEVGSLTAEGRDRQVELSWINPTDVDFTHVMISYSSGAPVDLFTGDNISRVIIAGLSNDAPYSFTLHTCDEEGNQSSGRSVDATPSRAIPGDVTGLTAQPGVGEVTLSWINPTDERFNQIEITYQPDGGSPPILLSSLNTTATISSLTPGTTYAFTIMAADSTGDRSIGETVESTPLASLDSAPPGPVTNLVHEAGNAYATLSWDDPGDTDLNHIEITYSLSGGEVPIIVRPGTGMVIVTGLTNGAVHTFYVVAVDNSGNSSAAGTAELTPQGDYDGDPPGNVVPGTVIEGNQYVVIQWTNPPDIDLNHIQVTHDQVGGDEPIYMAAVSQSGLITGLENGIQYTFTLVAVDESGNSSSGVTVTGTPNYSSDSLTVNITITTPAGVPIGLTGNIPVLNRDMYDQMTVVTDILDADVYNWYLDGTPVGSNQNQLLIESETLEVSLHEVYLVIQVDGSLHSTGIQFEVVKN